MKNLQDMTVDELRAIASQLEIPGRSSMNRDELIKSIQEEQEEQEEETEEETNTMSEQERAELDRRAAVAEENQKRQRRAGRG